LPDLICITFPYPCPTWTSSSGAKVAASSASVSLPH
jgi:hypothetical protein